jgi:hypothetical protein
MITMAPRSQPLGVRHVHPAVLGSPLVEGGVAEAALAAQLLDPHAGRSLLDEPDDLYFCESALLYVRHSLG